MTDVPRRFAYLVCDVFTDRIFGGNPLAVFPDAAGLSDDDMQRAAAEMNLSETVFVLPPDDPAHIRRLRIFTPRSELPFAGHPTVGAAIALALRKKIKIAAAGTRIVFEEGVGPVAVTVRKTDGPLYAELATTERPAIGPRPPSLSYLAAAVGLHAGDMDPKREPAAVSCGVPFLFIPVTNRAALRSARLEPARWRQTLATFWAPHVYLYTIGSEGENGIYARMFAPALGITEDPATGGAAATLAGYLAMEDPRPNGTLSWTIEQGAEMGRPSRLSAFATKEKSRVVSVGVGGTAVPVSEGVMTFPPSG